MLVQWKDKSMNCRSLLVIPVVFGMSLALLVAQPLSQGCETINLDQGWAPQQSEQFWFTSQGSRLMPYPWFLALEVPDAANQTLLRDRSNMDRYGYISMPPSQPNPDGLPIGFVK